MLKYRNENQGISSNVSTNGNVRSVSHDFHTLDHDEQDCEYHPLPQAEFLPSGLKRKRPAKKDEVLKESPLNRNKQRRSEERAVRKFKKITPAILNCVEHPFCVGSVPDSPKHDEAAALPEKVKDVQRRMTI